MIANPPINQVSKKRNGDGVWKISVPLEGDGTPRRLPLHCLSSSSMVIPNVLFKD